MRTLVLDIETVPNIAHVWGLWQQNVAPMTQLRVPGRVIGFAAKWHGEKSVRWYSDYHHSHEDVVNASHALVDQADAIIHYNGDRFDMPWLRTEWLLAGLQPPSPWKNIDLLKVVKKQFRFPSNKLDYVAQALGVGGKLEHTGHQMWVDIMEGDEPTRRKAWNLIRRYCKRDVVITEGVYDFSLGWNPSHPNLGLYGGDKDACIACGGAHVEQRGYKALQTRVYPQYHCLDCGRWYRDTHSIPERSVETA